MQNRLNRLVRESIDDYREREKVLKETEKALARDEDLSPLGMTIKHVVWSQAEERRRFFHERYDFDVQRWRAEDPTDWPSLPQGRNRRETDEIVRSALAYTFWEGVWTLTLAMEKTALERHIDPGWAICAISTAIGRYLTLRSNPGQGAWSRFYSELPALPAAVEVATYRIAQEAMANVARHAGAKSCTVRLRSEGGALEVEVLDDGAGLPDGLRAGVGLGSMRERAEELGGTFAVGSNPAGGTRVLARLPLPEWEEGGDDGGG